MTHGETVEVVGRPAAGAMRVSYEVEALEVSHNVATARCVIDLGEDSDKDGIVDASDVCVAVADPRQEDGDDDGVGDACAVCPTVADAPQDDENHNGIGDACEIDLGDYKAGGGGGCESGGTSVVVIALVALGVMVQSRRARRRTGP